VKRRSFHRKILLKLWQKYISLSHNHRVKLYKRGLYVGRTDLGGVIM